MPPPQTTPKWMQFFQQLLTGSREPTLIEPAQAGRIRGSAADWMNIVYGPTMANVSNVMKLPSTEGQMQFGYRYPVRYTGTEAAAATAPSPYEPLPWQQAVMQGLRSLFTPSGWGQYVTQPTGYGMRSQGGLQWGTQPTEMFPEATAKQPAILPPETPLPEGYLYPVRYRMPGAERTGLPPTKEPTTPDVNAPGFDVEFQRWLKTQPPGTIVEDPYTGRPFRYIPRYGTGTFTSYSGFRTPGGTSAHKWSKTPEGRQAIYNWLSSFTPEQRQEYWKGKVYGRPASTQQEETGEGARPSWVYGLANLNL